MSQDSQGSFFTATTMAVAIFLLAFGCLWTLGDFAIMPAAFFAALIAAIAWLVLFIGLGGAGKVVGDPVSGTTTASAPVATTASAPVATAASAPVAAAAATPQAADTSVAEEAAALKRQADAEAAEIAAKQQALREAEAAEIAEKKREAEAAAAKARADQEAAAKARAQEEAAAKARAQEEAAAKARAQEEAAAKAKADEEAAAVAAAAPAPQTDNATAATTPDYDGDGVREGTDEGTRPAGLDAPRDGKADDLKQIKGIGAKMEALCNRLGFWHFDQIAAWSADEVAWVDANLEGFKGRVTRDTWVEQARILAGGGETEFSKRVEDGDVY